MRKIILLLIFLLIGPQLIQSQHLDNSFLFGEDSLSLANPKEYYKAVTSYNTQENINKSLLTHRLDSLHAFGAGNVMPKFRFEFKYTEGKDIEVVWSFNVSLEIWEPFGFSSYHFDGKNKLKEQTFNNWDGVCTNLDEVNPLIKRKLFYNNQNNLRSVWRQDSNSIELNHLSSYDTLLYNSDGLLLKSERSVWVESKNALIKKNKVQYNHNTTGEIESIIRYNFEEEFGWYIEDSLHMIYNVDNQLEIENYYTRGPLENEFDYRYNKIYSYNADGSIDEVIKNTGTLLPNNYWNKVELDRYDYFDYGSLKKFRSVDVTNPLDYFAEQLYKSEYKHNKDVTTAQVRYPRTRFSDFFDRSHYYENHMLLEEESYGGGNNYEPQYLDYRNEYFYSEIITSTSEELEQQPKIDIYPNPSNDYIFFDGFEYSRDIEYAILNIQGQKVAGAIVKSNDKIDISTLPSGLYVLTIMYDDKLISKKLSVY